MDNGELSQIYDNDIEWMVEAYAEYVYRLAFEFTCDPVDAEDVTCATFLCARALCGHVSECDCVAAILYSLTSSIAHERLESNLSADEPDSWHSARAQSDFIVHPDAAHAACDRHLAGGRPASNDEFMDVSLDEFRPGLEAARAALGSVFGHGGYQL